MDLGATVCVRANPICLLCPLQSICQAHAQGRVADLPTPKPSRALPVRNATLWIVRSEERYMARKSSPYRHLGRVT